MVSNDFCSSRADAIARGSDGRLYFVEPCVEKMTMQELFAKLGSNQILNWFFDGSLICFSLAGVSDDRSSEVCYLQSQNGNLHSANSLNGDTDISEFEPLTCDVPKDISWCTEALGSILCRLHYSMSTQFRQDTCQRQSTYGLGTEEAQRAFITVKQTFVLFF